MQPLISVLIPSRNRIDILKNSINSLLSNANDPNCIQFLIRFDFDDINSIQRFNELPNRAQDKILFGNRFRGFRDHYLFLNEVAKIADGEFLFTWNDDTTMISKNWDLEVKKYSGQFIVLKAKHNMECHPDLNGNPIYPKKWVDLCGHVAMNCHTDSWIHEVATELDLQTEVNITIRNDAKHFGGFVDDQTYREGSIHQYDVADYISAEKTKIRNNDKQIIKDYLEMQKKN